VAYGFKFLLVFSLLISVSNCAHVISKDIRESSDPSLTLKRVSENPKAFQGKQVIWGGEIVETINQKDGTTQIEVFQRPLGFRGEPSDTDPSEGRFLVLAETYIDAYQYRRGRRITVAGELIGEKIQPIGKLDYRYPLLLSKQIYLWPEYYYYPYPYYYDDPWWSYPYYPRWWWGIGVRYRYHHHYQ
jgi:outer membrane lipoprotein